MPMKEKTSQKWPNVLKNLVVPQKLAQNDLEETNMIQMNQVLSNPSKEEVTNLKYTP
jgi:hypothetical protein